MRQKVRCSVCSFALRACVCGAAGLATLCVSMRPAGDPADDVEFVRLITDPPGTATPVYRAKDVRTPVLFMMAKLPSGNRRGFQRYFEIENDMFTYLQGVDDANEAAGRPVLVAVYVGEWFEGERPA